MDVRTGRFRRILRGASRPLRTNATREQEMLNLSHREHKTKEYVWHVWQQVNILVGHEDPLLSTIKRRKLSWLGHVCRHGTLPKITLQGIVDGSRRRRRPRKSWKDNIKRMDTRDDVNTDAHRE